MGTGITWLLNLITSMFGVVVFAGMPEGPLMMGSLVVKVFSVSKPGTSIGFMLFFAIVQAVNAVCRRYTLRFHTIHCRRILGHTVEEHHRNIAEQPSITSRQ
jgi:hypothetical protein